MHTGGTFSFAKPLDSIGKHWDCSKPAILRAKFFVGHMGIYASLHDLAEQEIEHSGS